MYCLGTYICLISLKLKCNACSLLFSINCVILVLLSIIFNSYIFTFAINLFFENIQIAYLFTELYLFPLYGNLMINSSLQPKRFSKISFIFVGIILISGLIKFHLKSSSIKLLPKLKIHVPCSILYSLLYVYKIIFSIK